MACYTFTPGDGKSSLTKPYFQIEYENTKEKEDVVKKLVAFANENEDRVTFNKVINRLVWHDTEEYSEGKPKGKVKKETIENHLSFLGILTKEEYERQKKEADEKNNLQQAS